MPGPTVLTIGNFDGVHLGHQALIERARAIAGGGRGRRGGESRGGKPGRVVAIAFHPHPVTVLAPGRATPSLSTFDQRAQWLRRAGADEVVRLEPTTELLALTPERFVDRLVDEYAPSAIVEGEDFRFGNRRAGDLETLRALGARHAFEVHAIEPVAVALTDQTIVTASSTITRWLLANGRVRDVERLLGRPYEMTGPVVRGDRLGRTLGFPTANLRIDTLAPGDGVYAARALLPGGRIFPAAVHVGPRATFDKPQRTVEAHIIGWNGPIPEGAPEYDWTLSLRMISWLRGQARFDSAQDLVNQMERDVQRAADVLQRERRGMNPSESFQEAGA